MEKLIFQTTDLCLMPVLSFKGHILCNLLSILPFFLTGICVSGLVMNPPKNEKTPSFTTFACSIFQRVCAKICSSGYQLIVMS